MCVASHQIIANAPESMTVVATLLELDTEHTETNDLSVSSNIMPAEQFFDVAHFLHCGIAGNIFEVLANVMKNEHTIETANLMMLLTIPQVLFTLIELCWRPREMPSTVFEPLPPY